LSYNNGVHACAKNDTIGKHYKQNVQPIMTVLIMTSEQQKHHIKCNVKPAGFLCYIKCSLV